MTPWWFPKAHFTTWDEIDSWFFVDKVKDEDFSWFDPEDDGEPFDTLDAKATVYFKLENSVE